jgi:hypothetical protein
MYHSTRSDQNYLQKQFAITATMYVSAMFCTWILYTINYIYYYVSGNKVNWYLSFFASVLLPLQGFLNACIYFGRTRGGGAGRRTNGLQQSNNNRSSNRSSSFTTGAVTVNQQLVVQSSTGQQQQQQQQQQQNADQSALLSMIGRGTIDDDHDHNEEKIPQQRTVEYIHALDNNNK